MAPSSAKGPWFSLAASKNLLNDVINTSKIIIIILVFNVLYLQLCTKGLLLYYILLSCV